MKLSADSGTTVASSNIPQWKVLAAAKREAREKKIPLEWRLPSSLTETFTETSTQNVLSVPRECGLLTEKEIELTENYDATALLELIATGKVSSYDVTLAFCKRAAIAHQCVNCLTEILFDEALARAKQCDEYLAKEGKTLGPFHGLPISMKDTFDLKGYQTTIGYVSFLSKPPATKNAALVQILYEAGAVFYVKTNLPLTMMTADSHNNIFGRTLNPNNLSLTAGGSTGGEGALLAMRGSPLGLATDIGGSIRIPAICNGISALKLTADRLPFGGNGGTGRDGTPSLIKPGAGPEGHSLRDYELLIRTVIDSKPWNYDETAINVPWRRVAPITRPIRLGLLHGHPKRPLHPSIARVIHTAESKLRAAGHIIVPLDDKIPDLYNCSLLAFQYYKLDPRGTPIQHVLASGEPFVPSMAACNLPEMVDYKSSLDGLFDMNTQRDQILRTWRTLIAENKLDAVLMPGYQATAVPHDTYGVPIYTTLMNLLNYPSGILPYLKAEKALDAPFFDQNAAYVPPYEPEKVEGAPGAIQIMGKPFEDEELLEVMKVVENVLA